VTEPNTKRTVTHEASEMKNYKVDFDAVPNYDDLIKSMLLKDTAWKQKKAE